MRPELTRATNADAFLDYYWLKEELIHFCRENDLPVSGSKMEISAKIEHFLRHHMAEQQPAKKRPRNKKRANQPLSRSTIITENHRCSQDVRIFLKQEIGPHFHFSTHIQQYFQSNAGNTYQDAIDAWHEEEKKHQQYAATKKIIAPRSEYNRFIRALFTNTVNKENMHNQPLETWNHNENEPYTHSS
ncbi:DUF6434 domain-containing protein [Terribacillus sp. DMT04]|uniref:DUF6434 domain-containing protein n=1 Tax=Terribacillus sp. DMT04 TaxID=2850441 RepID=UPI001C2C4B4F|nr:DUF6434 domain-containing protein [Terribacillus sp. DMT04]QXE02684.1 SAP domain-containing protein [Terribacillus sp. DMT04]